MSQSDPLPKLESLRAQVGELSRQLAERDQSREHLSAQVTLLQTIVDGTTDAVYIKDVMGRYRFFNHAAGRFVGKRPEDVIGHDGTFIFPRADAHEVMARDQMVMAGDEILTYEETLTTADGHRRTFHSTKGPLFDSEGAVIGLFGISRDMTARARAEEALQDRERYNRQLFERSPLGLAMCRLDGRFVDVNDAYARILGRSKAETLTLTYWDVTPETYAVQEQAQLERLLATGQYGPYEKEYRHKDGHLVPVRLSGVMMAQEGEPCIWSTVEDITAHKQAEEALRQSHAFLRQIIDTAPNFIFAKDREGRFTMVNQAVADAYGRTVEQLIGHTAADFNPNREEAEFFRQKDLDVMESRHELVIPEERFTDNDGRIRWLQTIKRPLLDEHGRAHMVLGASTDITERKHMEDALRQGKQDLRAAIEDRERISHDLHDGILQSLFAVGLSLEATKSTLSPGSRTTSGPPLQQAIDQLNRVMREVRHFIAGLGSDLLQGKDLKAALQHMLASLRAHQPTRLRLAVEDRAAQAVSEEQALHLFLVVQEAVSNSLRHGRAQAVTVSLKRLTQGIRLRIRDNGRGFNPKAAKGTGHGLRNMAARAQKLGGRLAIISKLHEGTRIVLDLPNEVADVRR